MSEQTRMEYFSQFLGLDAKRTSAWTQYGYKDTLTFTDYFTAYERTGSGHGAVHRILDKCWEAFPTIYEGDEPAADDQRAPTAFERAVKSVLSDPILLVTNKLKDFDRRNMVGRYSGLLYQVADGGLWSSPLGKGKLIRLIPLYESQIRVVEWNSDPTSLDFGQPSKYQIRTKSPEQKNDDAQPEQWVDVHPSRLQIMAEGSSGSMFDGVPLLKAGFNSLVNLEKIEGGSGEAFLKNSSRQLSIEFDKEANVGDAVKNGGGGEDVSVADALDSNVKALNKSIDSAIVTQGAKVQTLQSQMSDPESPWTINANVFAASVQIPFTTLFGQQTGRLASDQDQKDMAKRAKSRQCGELTPMMYGFITKLMQIGTIPTVARFGIEWADLMAASDTEKLENALKMADINEKVFRTGNGVAFEPNEIRVAAGYEKSSEYPVTESAPSETDGE
jgi:hypothetical protein